METSGVARPDGRSHRLKPGKAGLTGLDTEVSTDPAVLHARSSWAGSPVESRSRGHFL